MQNSVNSFLLKVIATMSDRAAVCGKFNKLFLEKKQALFAQRYPQLPVCGTFSILNGMHSPLLHVSHFFILLDDLLKYLHCTQVDHQLYSFHQKLITRFSLSSQIASCKVFRARCSEHLLDGMLKASLKKLLPLSVCVLFLSHHPHRHTHGHPKRIVPTLPSLSPMCLQLTACNYVNVHCLAHPIYLPFTDCCGSLFFFSSR
jgi:hypothetical protein